MRFTTIVTIALFAISASAAPVRRHQCHVSTKSSTSSKTSTTSKTTPTTSKTASSPSSPAPTSTTNSITADDIIAIDASAASCDNGPAPGECATAATAAPFISASFDQYGITSKGEQAAVLSLMMFESGSFKYNRNHFPGQPGQGTRNMMMFPNIYDYATQLSETASEAKSLVSANQVNSASNDLMNQVLALVLVDKYSFASAAWYYKNYCGNRQDIVDGLKAVTTEGWEKYTAQCVGTGVTDQRARCGKRRSKYLERSCI